MDEEEMNFWIRIKAIELAQRDAIQYYKVSNSKSNQEDIFWFEPDDLKELVEKYEKLIRGEKDDNNLQCKN